MATLLRNGTVLTMVDGARSDLTAIVVRDGVIAGTGSDREMTALAGSDAETIDLRGATVMPSLIDTHPHLMHFGVTAETHVDLSDATSHEDIVARIAARAAVTPEGHWILTTPIGEPHYFIRRSWRDLKEGELPRHEVLDRAAPRHPVMLQAWAPVVPNVCALNSEGLRRFGMTRRTPDRVSNVWIEKDAAGEPTEFCAARSPTITPAIRTWTNCSANFRAAASANF
jgi:predicted amidohydrolase YtcJ